MHRRPLPLRPVLVAAAAALLAACSDTPTHAPPTGAVDLAAPWTRTTAEAVGLDPARLFVAGELAARIPEMRSLLVVRRGRLAFERYYGGATADSLAEIGTATESIVSTLTGIGLRERLIESLGQPIGDFALVRELRPTDAHLDVTLEHLLTMTAGFTRGGDPDRIYRDWLASGDPLRYVLDRPLAAEPGSGFQHDAAAVYLLGRILEEAAQASLPRFADRTLLGPLGIGRRRWRAIGGGEADGTPGYAPARETEHANGAAGLALRPRDLARFGQLYLQEGWSGHRTIVPPDWVALATAPRFAWSVPIGPLDRVAFGLLWWVDRDHDAYFARDRSGQILYVWPGQSMVVVATTDRPQDGGGRPTVESAVLAVVARVLGAVR